MVAKTHQVQVMAVLSLAKWFGILVVKTYVNSIANGLKKEAGCPPKLHHLAVNIPYAFSLSQIVTT